MACCIVAALVLAILHGLTPWRRRTPDTAGFAPQATRPEPGTTPVPADVPRSPALLGRRAAALAWVFRFVAVGAVAYLAIVAVLVRIGAAHSMASGSLWATRTLVIVIVAGLATALSANIFRRGGDPLTRREIAGYAGIGFALTTIEAMALDMYLLSIYHVMNPLVHNGIHFAAFAVLLLGLALALPVARQPAEAV